MLGAIAPIFDFGKSVSIAYHECENADAKLK